MLISSIGVIICLVILNSVVLANRKSIESRIPEDGRLNFTELARKYGQNVIEYDIITEDGYILKLSRIFGDEKRAVLLIHGVLGTADDFLLRGNTSLGITLANAGYDVWAANVRGSKYSRRHLALNPDIDAAFWNYSIHEHGYYDIQANIDFVLKTTRQDKLSVIGYSQGTTVMYVLTTMRPEYNNKINILVSLAPICYLHHTEPYTTLLVSWSQDIKRGLEISHAEELAGYKSLFKRLWNNVCTLKGGGYELCLRAVLLQLVGLDDDEIDEEFFRIAVGHYPAGTSRRNLYHFGQIGLRKRFAMFDYGQTGNRIEYNWANPPEYHLNRVTMKVALIVANNDKIATIKDVEILRNQLPNLVFYKTVPSSTFNHLDYIWGQNTHKILFRDRFNLLEHNK